jgi:DNA ligase (NAD+)
VIPQEKVTLVQCDAGYRLFDEYLKEYLDSYRAQWPYETDGLILNVDDKRMHIAIDKSRGGAVKYHHFNIAIKPPARNAETDIIGIVWEVSMHWRIIPTAVLQKVIVGGAEFESVTLNNAETVEKLGIGIGSRILLERANDVIPKLVSVVSNEGISPFVIPTVCPSCGTPTSRDGKHIMCRNPLCSGRAISNIFNWVEKNDIKDVGRKTIEDLYNSGAVKTIIDLYTVDIDSVLSLLPGYKSGGSKITKINDSIQGTKGMSELDIISRIGIPMVGEIMAKNLQLFSIEALTKYLENGPYKKVVEQKIHEWFSDPVNQELMYSLRRILDSKVVKPVMATISKGINVVITGNFPRDRDSIKDELESNGYNVQSSVNGKTHVLLKGEASESSTKTEKAEALGIKIVSSLSDIYTLFP